MTVPELAKAAGILPRYAREWLEQQAAAGILRQATFEGYAKEAGFDEVSVLPIEHDFLRFYRLDR